MAAAVLGMAQMAAEAVASREQMRLTQQLREEEMKYRSFEMEWKEKDYRWKLWEMHQWQVDQKRHYVNEKSRQLSLLAEVCALLAAFSTIMLYEQGLPAPSDYWHSDVLLALWAVSTLSVPCINLCIMVISAMINFEILQVSSKETFKEALEDVSHSVTDDEYNPFGEDGKPQNLDTNGIINLPRRFLHWWHATEYDKRFRNMCLAFSYTLPVFMANLALTTLIKFFEYHAVAWICFVACMAGIPLWYRAHRDLILHLVKKESFEANRRRDGQELSAEGAHGQERRKQQGEPAQNPGISAQRPSSVRI